MECASAGGAPGDRVHQRTRRGTATALDALLKDLRSKEAQNCRRGLLQQHLGVGFEVVGRQLCHAPDPNGMRKW
jgi:hypothetical protein